MSRSHSPADSLPAPGRAAFRTTRWSRVLRAGDPARPDADAALAQLCRDYWYPLYAYARRCGLAVPDAQDATQGFFTHLLEADTLVRARSDLGRFRTFLLGAMSHYLANQRRQHAAKKRGGGVPPLSLDELSAEARYHREPADPLTPESQFERSWAFSLIERVFTRLGEDYARAGRSELFANLRPFLTADSARPGYDALARNLGLSTAAVGTAIHRMRRRYGELLREEIAHTVADPKEIEQEIAHLIAVVARG